MPKKNSIKRAAQRGARNVGRAMNTAKDDKQMEELRDAYREFKYIENELDYMEEEINSYHIRRSEFPGDLMGRPADDEDRDK